VFGFLDDHDPILVASELLAKKINSILFRRIPKLKT